MTWSGRRFLAAIGLAGAAALGGCAYDDGYYGGVSVGSGYYSGGYYVFDRRGHRHRWNDGQRRYWEGRRGQQGEHWRGSLARPEERRRSWEGRRWRDRDGAAATTPPVTRSEPRAGSPRGSWSGGRSGGSREGSGSRSDGSQWRGSLRR